MPTNAVVVYGSPTSILETMRRAAAAAAAAAAASASSSSSRFFEFLHLDIDGGRMVPCVLVSNAYEKSDEGKRVLAANQDLMYEAAWTHNMELTFTDEDVELWQVKETVASAKNWQIIETLHAEYFHPFVCQLTGQLAEHLAGSALADFMIGWGPNKPLRRKAAHLAVALAIVNHEAMRTPSTEWRLLEKHLDIFMKSTAPPCPCDGPCLAIADSDEVDSTTMKSTEVEQSGLMDDQDGDQDHGADHGDQDYGDAMISGHEDDSEADSADFVYEAVGTEIRKKAIPPWRRTQPTPVKATVKKAMKPKAKTALKTIPKQTPRRDEQMTPWHTAKKDTQCWMSCSWKTGRGW